MVAREVAWEMHDSASGLDEVSASWKRQRSQRAVVGREWLWVMERVMMFSMNDRISSV